MKQTVRKALFSLSVLTLSLIAAPVFSETDTPLYPDIKTASGFSRAMQTITGLTPMSSWTANRIISREIRKRVSGTLHSHLTLFSATDLIGRKARKIKLSGKNVLVDHAFPVSEFSFESKPDTPLFLSADKRPILLRPMDFNVSAVLSEADINGLLNSPFGQAMFTRMKVTIPPFGKQYFDLLKPSVRLEGDKVRVEGLINVHGKPVDYALPISLTGKLQSKDARLSLSDLDLEIEGYSDTEALEQLIQDYFSELVNLNRIKVDRHRVNVTLEKTEIRDRQIHLAATMHVEPDRKALQKHLNRHNQKTHSK